MSEQPATTMTAAVRGSVGGLLMGLANLVPGISGGTVLLAVGIYPQVIRGVAEVSTFRFRAPTLVMLATVVGGAAVAIAAGAGVIKDLVVDHRWVMYSLFIGLTLGGVPLLVQMVRPVNSTVVITATAGILAMLALAMTEAGRDAAAGPGDASARTAMLIMAGIAGGSAMILPGISGGYLLLVLGQYVVILAAIGGAVDALAAGDWSAFGEALGVLVPVGVGVVIGIVGVSNVIKICLDRFPRATLGFLLGLLLGAVAGLWPFQTDAPGAGTAAAAPPASVYFRPTVLQAAAAIGLAAIGFAASRGVTRLGREPRGGEADGTQGSGR